MSSEAPAGSIAETAISVMEESEMSGREEESPNKRITLGPRLKSEGDIYNEKDDWSPPEGAGSGPIARFLESLKSATEVYIDTPISRYGENTCALCPFRSFCKKGELALHARKYHVESTNYFADTSSHALALAKRIYEDSVSRSILSKSQESTTLFTGIL